MDLQTQRKSLLKNLTQTKPFFEDRLLSTGHENLLASKEKNRVIP